MVNTEKFITKAIAEIKTAAGKEKVVMALSGGVDSSVCAALAARAIGDNLLPIYIDTGLMRKGETDRIQTIFSTIHLDLDGFKLLFLDLGLLGAVHVRLPPAHRHHSGRF